VIRRIPDEPTRSQNNVMNVKAMDDHILYKLIGIVIPAP
jgi:hypothetical protein